MIDTRGRCRGCLLGRSGLGCDCLLIDMDGRWLGILGHYGRWLPQCRLGRYCLVNNMDSLGRGTLFVLITIQGLCQSV